MGTHAPRLITRLCDVAVLGSSMPLLEAALDQIRQGRSVIVVDPEGPASDESREAVRRNGGEVIAGSVVEVTDVAQDDGGHTRGDDGVWVELTGGHSITARRALTADGWVGVEFTTAGLVRSANERDWDRRYGGDQVWSGNPNGTLVAEASELAPGRALDVGAGEGGDVVWLAERGWTVTANDISRRALDRVAAEAGRRGLEVRCLHADANADQPFGHEQFDLVSAQYASIPRRPDDRAIRHLLDAVAPGGTLVAVGHDLTPMRAPLDTSTQSRMFDPDAYVRVDDLVAAIAGDPAWEIQVHEVRPRPPGAASAAHHVDDVVLRARRRN